MKKALFFEKIAEDAIQCELCPRECVLREGQRGFCRSRVNKAGELYATNYAQVSSLALDPIEKKPLYHFYPGTEILSVGTVGCNLDCKFCQNWSIAQSDAPTEEVKGEKLLQLAKRYDSVGIAFTYSEPLVWYEFILDTAQQIKGAGLKCVLVTNGMIQKEPLLKLLPYIDAVNLDVKAFRQEFYQEVCAGGDLATVKRTAELIARQCHLEVTTLLIPGMNDDQDEVEELVRWLADLNPDIPLHFSRYFPQYKLDLPPTPLQVMQQAKEIAANYIHYVYLGNVPDEDRNTYCHCCDHPVVKRDSRVEIDLDQSRCPKCGTLIPIIY